MRVVSRLTSRVATDQIRWLCAAITGEPCLRLKHVDRHHQASFPSSHVTRSIALPGLSRKGVRPPRPAPIGSVCASPALPADRPYLASAMLSQRQPDGLGARPVAEMSPASSRWAGAGRGGQNGGPVSSAQGQSSGAWVSLSAPGRWPSHGEDLDSSGPGSTPPGRAWANTSAAVASSSPRSRSAGPVASKPRVHQCWPPVWTSVSSTSHRGCWPGPGALAVICALAGGNRLMRRRLCTGRQPAGSALSWLSGLKGNNHSARTPGARGAPRLPPPGFPGSRGRPSPPAPRPRGPSPTARATADPAGRCPGVTPSGPEPPDPSGHRSRQLAREDPADLQAADRFGDQALRRCSRHRHMLLTLAGGQLRALLPHGCTCVRPAGCCAGPLAGPGQDVARKALIRRTIGAAASRQAALAGTPASRSSIAVLGPEWIGQTLGGSLGGGAAA